MGNLGTAKGIDWDEAAKRVGAILLDTNGLYEKSLRIKALVDGRGRDRVARAVLQRREEDERRQA